MTHVTPVPLGSKFDPPAVSMFAWEHLRKLENGERLDASAYATIGLQIEGEFGGGTVDIEGSNDGVHWHAMIDTQDNHMKFSYPGMADVGQTSRYLRPVVAGGDETTDVTVLALCRGT